MSIVHGGGDLSVTKHMGHVHNVATVPCQTSGKGVAKVVETKPFNPGSPAHTSKTMLEISSGLASLWIAEHKFMLSGERQQSLDLSLDVCGHVDNTELPCLGMTDVN